MTNVASAQPLDQHGDDFKEFQKVVTNSISTFIVNNKFIANIENRSLKMSDYHSLLLSIFHQVSNSSSSFALAGSMCSPDQIKIREYLFHHAEEEMTHWQWILDDLKSTGYTDIDPRKLDPSTSATAYLSYGYYLALKFPVGRLAMALVLEGISSSFGLKYGRQALSVLNLKPEQAQFFLAHGELDQGHQNDILLLLANSELDSQVYRQLCNVARITSSLYKEIYNNL